MDTISILILVVLALGLLLLALYSSQIEAFIENRLLNQAAKYAREVQALLFTLLGVILTELWRAVAVLDWAKVLIYVLIVFLIIAAIWDIRQRSEDIQRRLGSQFTKNLTASIKDAVKQALREDREEAKEKKRGKKIV